jgi:hypothetical protein
VVSVRGNKVDLLLRADLSRKLHSRAVSNATLRKIRTEAKGCRKELQATKEKLKAGEELIQQQNQVLALIGCELQLRKSPQNARA